MYQQIKTLTSFLELLNSIEPDWDNIKNEIQQAEYEQLDLLHEIELSALNCFEGFTVSKKLQEVRQRRRELKNLKEIIQPLKEFMNNNQKLKIDLYKVLSSMQRIEENQSIRSYYPRVRMDIKLAKVRENMDNINVLEEAN